MFVFVLLENGFHWLLSRAGVFAFSQARGAVIRGTDDPTAPSTTEPPAGIARIVNGMRMIEHAASGTPSAGKLTPIIEAFSPPKRVNRQRVGRREGGVVGKQQIGVAMVPMWARDP